MGLRQWLGLKSVDRSITDHDPVIVKPAPEDNPVRRFKATLPDGALDQPLETWPREQLAGYIVATCELTRMSFRTPEDWAIRSGGTLSHLLFDAGVPFLALPYNLEGSKDGVAREVGSFSLTRVPRTPGDRPEPARTAPDDQVIAQAADADAIEPATKVAPLWADHEGVLALFDETLGAFRDEADLPDANDDVETVERHTGAIDDRDSPWDHAFKATVYVLNVLEYLSEANVETYDQTMKGLVRAKETDPERAEILRTSAYVMHAERTEIAHPAPTVAVERSPGRRPM